MSDNIYDSMVRLRTAVVEELAEILERGELTEDELTRVHQCEGALEVMEYVIKLIARSQAVREEGWRGLSARA